MVPTLSGFKGMLKIKTSSLGMVLLIILCVCMSSCRSTEQPELLVVGLLNPNKGTQEISQGFIDGLKEYDRDNRIRIINYQCETPCDLDSALQELIDQNVSLLFTVTTPATKKAKTLTSDKNIPVVFSMNDPVKSGVINSLANPGGNVTGIQIRGSVPKALEWLLTLVPSVEHILVPIKFDTKAAKQSLEDLEKAAALLGKKITVAEINTPSELDNFLSNIPEDIDAFFFLHSIFIVSNAEKIAARAHEKKIVTASAIASSEKGVLMSFSPRPYEAGRQASRLAYNVLEGEAAAAIPAEVANFFLGINLDAARKLGLTVSDQILLQADYIIHK